MFISEEVIVTFKLGQKARFHIVLLKNVDVILDMPQTLTYGHSIASLD